MNENTYGLLLCDDLIFESRVAGTARAADLTLRCVKTAAMLLKLAQQALPRCVIVDLQTPALAIDELARDLRTLVPRPLLVGYGSHIDTATLKKARDAGFDVVWPRSKFAEELPTALPTWFI